MKNRNCLTMSVSSCLAVDKSDSNRLTSCSVLEEILNFYILIHTQYTRIYIYIQILELIITPYCTFDITCGPI